MREGGRYRGNYLQENKIQLPSPRKNKQKNSKTGLPHKVSEKSRSKWSRGRKKKDEGNFALSLSIL